jgi:hypothetical protein
MRNNRSEYLPRVFVYAALAGFSVQYHPLSHLSMVETEVECGWHGVKLPKFIENEGIHMMKTELPPALASGSSVSLVEDFSGEKGWSLSDVGCRETRY